MDRTGFRLHQPKKSVGNDKKDKVECAVENLSGNLNNLVNKLQFVKEQRAKRRNRIVLNKKDISERKVPNFKDYLDDEFKNIHKVLRIKKNKDKKRKKLHFSNLNKSKTTKINVGSEESFKKGGNLEKAEDDTSEISLLKKILSLLEVKVKNNTESNGKYLSRQNSDCSSVAARLQRSENSFGVKSSELEMQYNWLKNKNDSNGLNTEKKKTIDALIDKIKFLENVYKKTKSREEKSKPVEKSFRKNNEHQFENVSERKKHVRFNRNKDTEKTYKMKSLHKTQDTKESRNRFEIYTFNLPTQPVSSDSSVDSLTSSLISFKR